MGEIDSTPIESVQTALSFFGQREFSPVKKNQKEEEMEKEVEILIRQLSHVKLELEAKSSAYNQALLKLEYHQKTSDDLSTLLKNSDYHKQFYITEFQEATAHISQLESAMSQMADKLAEFDKLRDHLSTLSSDLVSTQAQLSIVESELALVRHEKHELVQKNEALGMALGEEKMRSKELMMNVSELHQHMHDFERKVVEINLEKDESLSARRAEIDSAEKALAEAEEKLRQAAKNLENMRDLESQVFEKSVYIASLEIEVKQANERCRFSDKAVSDATEEINQLKEEVKLHEQKFADQAGYASLLDTELRQLRIELGNANEGLNQMSERAEAAKAEVEQVREKENDAQVEIAMLKFEVHKGRSKLAASETAEARSQSEKTALFNALQEMGLEIEECKKENRVLKEALKLADQSGGATTSLVELEEKEPATFVMKGEKNVELFQDKAYQSREEVENLRKELEVAVAKVGEFRNRSEQAISRAEAAEKGKAILELQMKKIKEHKERRKAALAALREESVSSDPNRSSSSSSSNVISSSNYDDSAKNYQPLHKVLNMKF